MKRAPTGVGAREASTTAAECSSKAARRASAAVVRDGMSASAAAQALAARPRPPAGPAGVRRASIMTAEAGRSPDRFRMMQAAAEFQSCPDHRAPAIRGRSQRRRSPAHLGHDGRSGRDAGIDDGQAARPHDIRPLLRSPERRSASSKASRAADVTLLAASATHAPLAASALRVELLQARPGLALARFPPSPVAARDRCCRLGRRLSATVFSPARQSAESCAACGVRQQSASDLRRVVMP